VKVLSSWFREVIDVVLLHEIINVNA
jgi:hypothetical protein